MQVNMDSEDLVIAPSGWSHFFARNFRFARFAEVASSREPALDIVRGVAILLAVGWHFNTDIRGGVIVTFLAAPGRLMGWAGVDLFFVLSGFLIGRAILDEVRKTGRFRFKAFFIRRVFRLWPVLFLFLAVHLMIADRPWNSFLLQTVFSLQNYLPTTIPILWSLAVEEHFYLVIGLLFLLFPKQAARPEIIFPGLAIILVVAPVLRCCAYLAGWTPVSIQLQTQFRMDALAAGVLLAALSVYKPEMFGRIVKAKWLLLTGTAIGSAVLCHLKFLGGFECIAGFTIAYITSACFMLLLYGSKLGGWRMLVARPFIRLGVYAYPMYIWQFSGLAIAKAVIRHVRAFDTPLAGLVLSYGFTIAIAALIAVIIEQPFMRMGKTVARRMG
jgi:peptidoglycan/LPS O-acetylase OafA/YrhL